MWFLRSLSAVHCSIWSLGAHLLLLFLMIGCPFKGSMRCTKVKGLCQSNFIKHLKFNTTKTQFPSCPPKSVPCSTAHLWHPHPISCTSPKPQSHLWLLSYAILLFTALDLTSTNNHNHNWVLFLLWLRLFILSGVISPLISGSILGTYWPGEFIFQCPIFLPLHVVHGVLKARILEWVAIPFSRESSWPRDQTWVSCIACRFFTVWDNFMY